MPLAKFTKGRKAGISDTIAYDLREGKHFKKGEGRPTIAFQNGLNFCNSYEEIAKSFDETYRINQGNSKVKKKYERLVISFSPSESKLIMQQNQIKICQEILEDYVKRQGQALDNFQHIGIRHTDKKHHTHYHITINRKGFDTKTLKDSLSKMKIAESCFYVEKKYGLEKFENRKVNPKTGKYDFSMKKELLGLDDRKVLWKDKSKKIESYKTYLGENIEEALQQSVSIDELTKGLAKKDIDINYKEYETKDGKRYSSSFASKDYKIAGSKLGFKGKFIHNTLNNNRDKLEEWFYTRLDELLIEFKNFIEDEYTESKESFDDMSMMLYITYDSEIRILGDAYRRLDDEDKKLEKLYFKRYNELLNEIIEEAIRNKNQIIEQWKKFLHNLIRTEHNINVLDEGYPKLIVDDFIEENGYRDDIREELLTYVDDSYYKLISERKEYLYAEEIKNKVLQYKASLLNTFESRIRNIEEFDKSAWDHLPYKIVKEFQSRYDLPFDVVHIAYRLEKENIDKLFASQKRKIMLQKDAEKFRGEFFRRINGDDLSELTDVSEIQTYIDKNINVLSNKLEIDYNYAMKLFQVHQERILLKLKEKVQYDYEYSQRRSRGRRW